MTAAIKSEKTFEEIVQQHYEALYRFAHSLSRNANDACDLTQQTFFLWASKGHQLRDKSKVKSWLFTTLYREFLGIRRKQTRFPQVEVEQVEHVMPSISPNMVNELDGDTIVDLLHSIEETYRVPLTLFYLQQHSYLEIAEILNIPIGTVMSRLSRGKSQLRTLIRSHDSGGIKKKIVPMNPEVPGNMKTGNGH
jgi:RNA polymerase sigma factor (sigma-70 family)